MIDEKALMDLLRCACEHGRKDAGQKVNRIDERYPKP